MVPGATETTETTESPGGGGRRRPVPARRPGGRLIGRREATPAAYRRLRDLIVSGRLTPGAALVETELSQRLGVSRTPVRAALQRLQQEGFVTASRAGSMLRAMVAPLTADDMREVFLLAGALESAAARLTAGLEPRRREVLAATLARIAGQLQRAATASPPDAALAHALHVRFHRGCTEAAAGPRLLAELDVLRPQAERYQRVYASAFVQASKEAARDRAAIVSAIGAGDEEGAARAVTRTWRAAAERCGHVVSILGERGNW